MDREAWWASVHGVSKSDTTKETEHPHKWERERLEVFLDSYFDMKCLKNLTDADAVDIKLRSRIKRW